MLYRGKFQKIWKGTCSEIVDEKELIHTKPDLEKSEAQRRLDKAAIEPIMEIRSHEGHLGHEESFDSRIKQRGRTRVGGIRQGKNCWTVQE